MRLRMTIWALLCSATSLLAQNRLSIGDSVPDIQLNKLVNNPASSLNLSDARGRVVIIGFWATWCTSCLRSFTKLDSLQIAFKDKLQIILVNTRSTGDNRLKVQAFFDRWEKRTGKKLSLPTLVDDTTLDKIFPHQLIPHYVWIGKDGKLLATSSSDAITSENIRAAWRGEELLFTMKKDQDGRRPLFSTTDLPSDKLLNYSVFIKGWFDGLPVGSRARVKEDIICGKAMTNTLLLDMYKSVAAALDPSIDEKRFFVLTEDSSEFFPPVIEEREGWYKQHAYTLDIVVPLQEAGHLHQRMLEMLNAYSGYSGRFEKIKMNCWILVKKDTVDRLRSKEEKEINNLWSKNKPFLQNGSIELLVQRLNAIPAIKQPVLNEMGYAGKVDIHFPDGLDDLTTIQKQLASYGIELQQQQMITIFVLQKKKTN
jgi:thiol-disulfide isomerase/thioredoxin